MSKYKVGDRVRTIKDRDFNGTKLFPKKTIGVIACIDYEDRLPYRVFDLENTNSFFYSEDMLELLNEKTYEDGLADAWELARKICGEAKSKNSNLTGKQLGEIFGYSHSAAIMDNNTYQQALSKIEAYEKSQQIQVGDVVGCFEDCENDWKDNEENYGVVTGIYDSNFQVLMKNGDCAAFAKSVCKKTGQHIDIEHLLEQIRGNE